MPLGFVDPETFAPLVAVVALMIPIVAILTKHQQKMADIIHGAKRNSGIDSQAAQEIQALRLDVEQLKQLVTQQTINYDTLASKIDAAALSARVRSE